jgi:hypothetical protein
MNTTLKVLNRELEDLRAQANKPFNTTAQDLFIWAEVRRVEGEIAEETAKATRQRVWG